MPKDENLPDQFSRPVGELRELSPAPQACVSLIFRDPVDILLTYPSHRGIAEED